MNRINTPTSSSHHILSLQSMRFIFCTLIFIYHFFESTGKFHFYYGGDAGVTFFFILSGFVLSMGCGASIKNETFEYVQFLRKRLAKIYPLHLVTFTIALCMSFVAGVKFNITKTLLHVFMLQEFTLSEDMLKYGTGLSWFLGALFFCYLLFRNNNSCNVYIDIYPILFVAFMVTFRSIVLATIQPVNILVCHIKQHTRCNFKTIKSTSTCFLGQHQFRNIHVAWYSDYSICIRVGTSLWIRHGMQSNTFCNMPCIVFSCSIRICNNYENRAL